MVKDDPLSLMAAEARGGDIAEGGFRAQDHLTIARIPRWLAEDGFTTMIREAHGDAEAAFYVPQVGLTREFVEYKDFEIQPAILREEILRFQRMANGTHNAYLRFVLSSRGHSVTVRPLHAALRRVRGALPFYADVPAISDTSYADYLTAAAKVELDSDAARFLFEKVILEPEAPAAEAFASALFEESMRREFPATAEATGRQMTSARQALTELITSNKATPVTRGQILDAIALGLPVLVHDVRSMPIRLHTPITASQAGPVGAVRTNWSAFFGDENRRYPPADEWNRTVVQELAAFRDWVTGSGRTRNIVLSGTRRLSTSFAIGRTLSAVAGFKVSMEYRGEIWRTDSYPTQSEQPFIWQEEFLPGDEIEGGLSIGIGILNNVKPEVSAYLDRTGGRTPRLFLHSTAPITSDAHANSAVNSAKIAIQAALKRSGAIQINLFLAAPAHFALFLGHRMNATATVKCHERSEMDYVPTCTC